MRVVDKVASLIGVGHYMFQVLDDSGGKGKRFEDTGE